MSNDIDGIMETFKGVSAQGHRLELAQKPGSLPEVPLMRQNRQTPQEICAGLFAEG
ncbi:conserved protein of unknown function [Xenorhabdus bovienii]|uniref:Uncharacterized protein n=1 Tax=Xenorhabdus bovienii TaxID=40576 RepID=A0A0B6XBL5_XENBV|nr:conserved protein of unknown function [Xenorhabdus bovienii]